MSAEAWQTAEIAGPTKALVIPKPEVVAEMVKRAKRKIMVIGQRAALPESDGFTPIEEVIRIAKAADIPIVATGYAVRAFEDRSCAVHQMSAMEIGSRLSDGNWRGLDEEGAYDLALFMGFPYYVEWLLLSGLKHFANGLKSISLGRYYQPHASWSFPNISVEDWKRNLGVIAEKLGGK